MNITLLDQYVDIYLKYLANDNGVVSKSHLIMIDLLKDCTEEEKNYFHKQCEKRIKENV